MLQNELLLCNNHLPPSDDINVRTVFQYAAIFLSEIQIQRRLEAELEAKSRGTTPIESQDKYDYCLNLRD